MASGRTARWWKSGREFGDLRSWPWCCDHGVVRRQATGWTASGKIMSSRLGEH